MATKNFSPPASIDGMSRRGTPVKQVAIAANLANCDVLSVGQVADLAIKVPAAVTSLTFHASGTENGTYVPVDTAVIDTTAKANTWVTFPPACFPHLFLKLQSAGADASAEVVAKS